MKSIKKELEYKYLINKSEFISVIKYIDDVNDVDLFIDELKKRYKDATHYCYAYIINNYKKCSDDKEPQGTAGLPILNVLEKNELTNVVCVVIRYFGGIKLGAGGLTRSYSKSVSDNLIENKDSIGDIIDGYELDVEVSYSKQSIFEYKYKNIINKEFNDNIIYKINVDSKEKEELENTYNIINVKEKKIIY